MSLLWPNVCWPELDHSALVTLSKHHSFAIFCLKSELAGTRRKKKLSFLPRKGKKPRRHKNMGTTDVLIKTSEFNRLIPHTINHRGGQKISDFWPPTSATRNLSRLPWSMPREGKGQGRQWRRMETTDAEDTFDGCPRVWSLASYRKHLARCAALNNEGGFYSSPSWTYLLSSSQPARHAGGALVQPGGVLAYMNNVGCDLVTCSQHVTMASLGDVCTACYSGVT